MPCQWCKPREDPQFAPKATNNLVNLRHNEGMKRLIVLLFVFFSQLAHAQWTIVNPKFDALPNAKAYFGTRDGAFGGQYAYRAEIPERWNGDLVMYAHGFKGTGPNLNADMIPARKWFVDNGYAWAASSYSANGWAVRQGADETKDLAEFISSSLGKPKRIFILGASMGGNVITDSLGNYPTFYNGAMPICGAMTGLELFDYFLSYALVGEYISGIQLVPSGGDAVSFYINKYFGGLLPILGQPKAYTAKGLQFDSIIKHLSGGERPYRTEGMLVETAPNVNFYSAWFSGGGLGVVNHNLEQQVTSNIGITYKIDPNLGLDAVKLNAEIKRVRPNPDYRILEGRYWYGIPSGRILVPVMSYHTTGDAFVPLNMQISYRQKVESRGRGDLLVQRLVRRPGHCEFTEAEITQGFADLVKWVDTGIKPKGDDVLGDLTRAGLEWTKPLRDDDPLKK
jgi:pimeloyl-ACP methyl ester carboxylesterase